MGASLSKCDAESSPASLAFDAVIFDLDGVITRTATSHARGWKQAFDDFLALRAQHTGEPFLEFQLPGDYLAHVDGRSRYDGVEAFLRSRAIALPRGTSTDAPGFDTVCALGNLKNDHFNRLVAEEGVGLYRSSLALIEGLKAHGVRIGLATSSRNAAAILKCAGIAHLFEVVVDGLVSEKLVLNGKPAPDIFLAACTELGVEPGSAIIVEDAASGVQAGVLGGFALIVGIARGGNAEALREHGAHLVVTDLVETSVAELNRLVCAGRAHHGA